LPYATTVFATTVLNFASKQRVQQINVLHSPDIFQEIGGGL